MNLHLDGGGALATLRLLALFLRQRAVLDTLAMLLAIDIMLVAITGWIEIEERPERVGYLLLLAPCVIPAIVGTAMWSRGADMEVNVPYPLHWSRLIHLAVLGCVGIGGSTFIVGSWMGQSGEVHQGLFWLRYTLVALALALGTASTIGARIAWVAPLMLVATVFLLRARIETPLPADYPWWMWVLRRVDDPLSWVATGVILAAALARFVCVGPRRDEPGEA